MRVCRIKVGGAARSFVGRLSAKPTSKTTTVAVLSLTDNIPQRGSDYIQKLVEIYNEEANEDNNEEARRTSEFIKERLELIRAELNETEENLVNEKQKSNIVDFASDTKSDQSQRD